jgi:hypothetical protein
MVGFMPATQDHHDAVVILGGWDKPGHDGGERRAKTCK